MYVNIYAERNWERKREGERIRAVCLCVCYMHMCACMIMYVVVPVLSYYTNTNVFPGFELRWVRRLKLGREMLGRNLCRSA